MGWLPGEPLAGQCARRGLVDGEEGAERAEILGRGGLDGNTESPADHLGDCTHGVCFVSHRMQDRPGWGSFERDAEQRRCIVSVYGRPALRTVADIG